jgi:hypothetical protein
VPKNKPGKIPAWKQVASGICSSETSGVFQQTTRRYIPEDSTLHIHRWENFKSCVQYRVHKSPPMISVLSQINPVHIFPLYYFKVMVNLSQCLINLVPRNEDVWESGCVAPPFLISVLAGGEWSDSRLCRLTPRGKDAQYLLDRRLGGTQSWSGRCREEKYLSLAGNRTPAI